MLLLFCSVHAHYFVSFHPGRGLYKVFHTDILISVIYMAGCQPPGGHLDKKW